MILLILIGKLSLSFLQLHEISKLLYQCCTLANTVAPCAFHLTHQVDCMYFLRNVMYPNVIANFRTKCKIQDGCTKHLTITNISCTLNTDKCYHYNSPTRTHPKANNDIIIIRFKTRDGIGHPTFILCHYQTIIESLKPRSLS